MHKRVFVACCALSLISAGSGVAQERYYAVLFASGNGAVRFSHSFAVFLKAEGQTVESFTISWMPASGTLRIFGGAVPGRNFSLQESLAWANQRGLPTRTWGPFEIDKELYDRAVNQKRRLESGAVAYKLLDRRTRPWALNCIHALTDVTGSRILTGTARGNGATAIVSRLYAPHYVVTGANHDWVLTSLELDGPRRSASSPSEIYASSGAQSPKSLPRPTTSRDPSRAIVNVRVPDANAEVLFNGSQTQQRGLDRVFETPPLTDGLGSVYDVRARWLDDRGEMREETRPIEVQAGQEVTVEFRRSFMSVARPRRD